MYFPPPPLYADFLLFFSHSLSPLVISVSGGPTEHNTARGGPYGAKGRPVLAVQKHERKQSSRLQMIITKYREEQDPVRSLSNVLLNIGGIKNSGGLVFGRR